MRRTLLLFVLSAAACASAPAASSGSRTSSGPVGTLARQARAARGGSGDGGAPSNPAIDADFADPGVMRDTDGTYYAYATQTGEDPSAPGASRTGDRFVNLQVSRSKDLARWDAPREALPAKPAWSKTKHAFWAPSPARDGATYYLYYAAEQDDSKRFCIGVATAASPLGPFTDVGAPVLCDARFSVIDPMPFDDPKTGKHLLYFNYGLPEGRPRPLRKGQDDSPIAVVELADRTHVAPSAPPIPLLHPWDERPYEHLFEGAWVILHEDTYYLFYSGDNCCQPNARYAVMVARAKSATGPFDTLAEATGRPTSAILESNDRWLAPGHNAVVEAPGGGLAIVYDAIDRRRDVTVATGFSRRPMLVDGLAFEGGWPVVTTRR